MLSRCLLDFSVGVVAFFIGMSQTSSFFSPMIRCVLYNGHLQPFLSTECLFKTGYLQGVCHAWFHLHGLARDTRNAKQDENQKIQILV